MISEITLDGETIATTPVMTLGESLRSRLGYAAQQQSWLSYAMRQAVPNLANRLSALLKAYI